MADQTLLLWSKSHEKYISEALWQSDRVIEVPDDVTTDNMKDVANKLSPIIFEEIAKSKEKSLKLRVIPLTSQAFSSVLMGVLENNLQPNDGELLHLKIKKKNHDAPTVILDDASVGEAISSHGIIDFNKPPMEDKPMFSDGLDNNSLTPPAGF
jgi:hypothetical protein